LTLINWTLETTSAQNVPTKRQGSRQHRTSKIQFFSYMSSLRSMLSCNIPFRKKFVRQVVKHYVNWIPMSLILIQEIIYNCINRHLISHHIRGECVLWVLKLPGFIAEIVSDKRPFILTLKKYLIEKSFYSIEDLLMINTYVMKSEKFYVGMVL
jgi:hypothetical protein